MGVVAVCAAILLWFFIVGLGDGSVDGDNLMLWFVMLAVPITAILLAGPLWTRGQRAAALVLLLVPGIPSILYGLFLALMILAAPDFR
jgi:hypothetical protein